MQSNRWKTHYIGYIAALSVLPSLISVLWGWQPCWKQTQRCMLNLYFCTCATTKLQMRHHRFYGTEPASGGRFCALYCTCNYVVCPSVVAVARFQRWLTFQHMCASYREGTRTGVVTQTAWFRDKVTCRCGKSKSKSKSRLNLFFFVQADQVCSTLWGGCLFSFSFPHRTGPFCQNLSAVSDSLLLLQLGVYLALQLLLTLQLQTQIPELGSQTKHCNTGSEKKKKREGCGRFKELYVLTHNTLNSPVQSLFLPLYLFLQLISLLR